MNSVIPNRINRSGGPIAGIGTKGTATWSRPASARPCLIQTHCPQVSSPIHILSKLGRIASGASEGQPVQRFMLQQARPSIGPIAGFTAFG